MTRIGVFAVTPDLQGRFIKIQGRHTERMLRHPPDSRIYPRNNPADTSFLLFVLTTRDTFSVAGVLFN